MSVSFKCLTSSMATPHGLTVWLWGAVQWERRRGGWAVDAASDGLISYRRRGKKTSKKPGLLEFIPAWSHAQQHKFLLLRVWASKFKFKAVRGSCVCGWQTIRNWVNLACNTGLILKRSIDILCHNFSLLIYSMDYFFKHKKWHRVINDWI